MKRTIVALLALLILPAFAVVMTASAQTFRSADSTIITKDENINSSVWAGGANVDVAGTIDGDLFCAGQTVTVSGTVNGDILCAGQTVTVSGNVAGDVRVMGQTVAISANIAGNVSAAGQTMTLDSNAVVGQDASFAGQTVRVNGKIGRDLAIGSELATISAQVNRNITADIENLTLTPSASIDGNVIYTSPQKLQKDTQANVQGEITYTKRSNNEQPEFSGLFIGAGIGLIALFTMVVSAMILSLVFPRELHSTTNASIRSFTNVLLAVLVGFVAGIIVPAIIIMLLITVLGIPLAILIGTAWLLILLLSGAVTAYYAGRVIWRGQTNAVLIMTAGALLVALLLLVPFIGALVALIAVWYGSGALLLQLKQLLVAPRYSMTPPKVRRTKKA